jgi:beta-aspartyl-peptidase (threonine type)
MRFLVVFFLITIFSCTEATKTNSSVETRTSKEVPQYAMVIHGGAGTILKKNMSEEKEKAYRDALNEALSIGEKILKNGGDAIDAVEATIHSMEDNPLFNAGVGAVFTHDGTNSLDASIMRGEDQNAGAMGGVSNVKHPISGARAVLEKSEHVMLAGKGAESFAEENGLEIVDPSHFYTKRRWDALQKILTREEEEAKELSELSENKHGTVGCVALDSKGNICAGTSTGGMTNKKYDRIGDAPIIGAGTYADNSTCGVSCTGHGEFFIRYAVAYDVAARMEYKGISLDQAANEIVNEKLVEKGGSGGLVSLDRYGNIAMPFNSEGMYRGYVKPGERVVKIYKDE